MTSWAFVFPGQGSQFVGMGKDLWDHSPAARETLREADDVLGFSLTRICFEGPEGELTKTQNAQPAILAVSTAALAALREQIDLDLAGCFVAGHSLGEFGALVAAEALDYKDALRLVRLRGELMSAAAAAHPGGMAAVLGLDDASVEEACREARGDGVVVVANYNGAGQTVISGEMAAVQRAGELAKAKGARRVVSLAVSGPFHSPLLEVAAEPFADGVAKTSVVRPRATVISNITARPLTTATAIKDELPRQMVMPVRWSESVSHMIEHGADFFVEIGPGQVLTGLLKRSHDVKTAHVDSVDSASSVAAMWRASR